MEAFLWRWLENIPPHVPETEDEKQRDQAAKMRRAFKNEFLEKLKKTSMA